MPGGLGVLNSAFNATMSSALREAISSFGEVHSKHIGAHIEAEHIGAHIEAEAHIEAHSRFVGCRDLVPSKE